MEYVLLMEEDQGIKREASVPHVTRVGQGEQLAKYDEQYNSSSSAGCERHIYMYIYIYSVGIISVVRTKDTTCASRKK